MTDPSLVVRRFLVLLEQHDLDAAQELLHDDVEWCNTRLPTVRGKRRVSATIRAFMDRGFGFEVRIHHLAADGPMVLTERTDVLTFGRFATAFWVCGTFEVRDGKIRLWDDHFSWANFTRASLQGAVRAVLPKSSDVRPATVS